MNHERSFNVDEILSASWDQLLARDLAAEVENVAPDKRCSTPELRRFFAIKGCRDQLARFKAACENRTSFDALRSVAREMRQYALERPALWAAASRKPANESAEWRVAHNELCDLIKSVLAECEMHGQHAEDALSMLWSLVRGFATHQIIGSFLQVYSYDETFERVVEIYAAGVRSVGTAAAKAAASGTTRE